MAINFRQLNAITILNDPQYMGDAVRNIIIFGNSGSGKSTLATQLALGGLSHLDLDTLAWLPTQPATRKPYEQAKQAILDFTAQHQNWVIEGCYADLLKLLIPMANEMIFMNLSINQCLENAIDRPWESHKYASKTAQDKNLHMLLDWIVGYKNRDDELSYKAHRELYVLFNGRKTEITSNSQSQQYAKPQRVAELAEF